MPSNAVSAQGSLLKIGDGGGTEVFTTIAEVRSISGPTASVNLEDVTSHDSSAWMEKIPTLIDAGEISFEINYTSHTTQDQLRTDMFARTKRNFQLVLVPLTPDETIAFAAYITGFEVDAPHDGVLRASVTLAITGAITWT